MTLNMEKSLTVSSMTLMIPVENSFFTWVIYPKTSCGIQNMPLKWIAHR